MTQVTTATKKLLALRKKNRAISGGTGASKTYSIIMILIDYAQSHDNEKIDIVSESYPHLEAGVMTDFKEIMKESNYWKDSCWNQTAKTYNFESGTVLKFISVDKIGKAHGPRRDVLFLNECNYIDYAIADQLMTRTRKIVWLDWNPSEDFWFDEKVYPNEKDEWDFMGEAGNLPPLTYLDNEALSEIERNKILAKKYDESWWKVYGLGLKGEIEGRVYKGWQLIDEIPHEARLEGYGLDFGYDPDPAAIVAVYYYNGGYILDEILYQRQVDNPELAKIFKNHKERLVVADSAEPKSIAEIHRFGVNIVGAEKGKESVRYGVKTLQAQRISVTKRSINLIKEYRNYIQAIDRKTRNVIIGKYEGICHALDAARYKICSLIPIKQRREVMEQVPNFPSPPQINPV